MVSLHWHDRAFADLTVRELYAILALRDRVFVVEQRCAYLEADGHDQVARHLWATTPTGDIHAYLRILPAGEKFAEIALGRVVVAPEARGTGLGRVVVRRGLEAVGPVAVRIAAQTYLEAFYNELGFHRVGDPYDEDGISHLDMIRPA